MYRDHTKEIQIGDKKIGGGNPVLIQSMCNTPTQDVSATVAQIRALEEAGCQIVRLAVPDREAARAIRAIKAQVNVPLVADIHFDHRLALEAVEAGADKSRINPGNIGDRDKIRAVADAVGIPDGQPLDTRDRTTMLRMAAAVSRVENGAAADMGEVELGWELFVRDKPASG